MIPDITEVNFGPGTSAAYATLHQATVSLTDMGERTISTQVRIDGDVVPDFDGWELIFKGERFILPIKDPQASKDNSSRNSLIDLTFYSWPIVQLRRYFFITLSTISTEVEVPDEYNATITLNASGFASLFQRNLSYYYGDSIRIDLNPNAEYSAEPSTIEIDHTFIWDVLSKVYEAYNLRWTIIYDSVSNAYVIKVGYPSEEIDDHDFAYGFSGGLLKFERQVQDDNIHNILLGRGGEKNLPYRYYKKVDPQNPDWAADPDAIPELANVYFDRLRDIVFRWYVRGWVKNPLRDPSGDVGYNIPDYDYDDVPEEYLWAYVKGRDTDTKFNPIEYVKDDDSIEKYGERWGAVDDNDDVYPTIQNAPNDADEVVAVSEIITDDIEAAAQAAAEERNIESSTVTHFFDLNARYDEYIDSERFTVPTGKTGNVYTTPLNPYYLSPNSSKRSSNGPSYDRVSATDVIVETSVTAIDVNTGTSHPIAGLTAGTYYLHIRLVAYRTSTTGRGHECTYGLNSATLAFSEDDTNTWKPTFDIWVKNIWNSTQGVSESDTEYAARVWGPILGDRLGNEAKLVFSTGFMSISEDYEFVIASYPVKDRSKTLNNVPSEWKITLYKSDAEFDATGLYVPNSTTGGKPQAGDRFFFIGIDMPHEYVEWAEERLNNEKTSNLDESADINPTWVISLDKIRVNTLADNEYGQVLADRLKAGCLIRIADRRFTGGNILSLYAQTITYTWQEPGDGAPYTIPDIEVVLSDKVVSSESPIGKLNNDVSGIRATYVRTVDLDSTIRRIATPLFLKKTGESDVSASPTSFASKIMSQNFRMGSFGGVGWGFYVDGGGLSTLELDKLIVRSELSVNTVIANQISYMGGRQIVSAAAIQCVQVDETEDGYVCYFDQKEGSVANLFHVGDIAMGQQFDAENVEERYYRAAVIAVAENTITLSSTNKSGAGLPQVGDTIVQYGHISDANRQFVIIRDVIGGGYEQMLSGLDSVSATGSEYYFAGAKDASGTLSPRWFIGNASGEYAKWENGELAVKGRITVLSADGDVVMGPSTVIAGGSVLSSLIGVVDGSDVLQAGINALDDYDDSTHGTLMIFAGSNGDAVADITGAPFRVYEDGTVYSSKLVAEAGCTIGAFSIMNDTLIGTSVFYGSHRDDDTWANHINVAFFPSQLNFNVYTSSNTNIGGILIGSSLSAVSIADSALLDIKWSRTKTQAGGSEHVNRGINCSITGTNMEGEGAYLYCHATGYANYGARIDVGGATNNIGVQITSTGDAIRAVNGMYAGFRPNIVSLNTGNTPSNPYSDLYNIIICANTSTITHYLPSSPKKGQMYIVHHTTTSSLTINGNGKNLARAYGDGTTSTTSSVNVRQTVWLFYDGSKWVINYLSH